LNRQIILTASIILSTVTVIYGIVFSFQLGGNIFIGLLLSAMMLGFNILEFTMIYYIAIFIKDKMLLPIIFGIFIVITGILFSIFSNIWVVSNSYSDYKSLRNAQSERYKAWEMQKNRIEQQISEISQKGISNNLDSEISSLSKKVDLELAKQTYNSQNRRTGKTVGQITNRCTTENYYSRNYCTDIINNLHELSELNGMKKDLNKKSSLVRAVEELYKNPPTAIESHAPGISSITEITNLTAEKIIAMINLMFAICNEIGAIFGWYILGYTKKRINPNKINIGYTYENNLQEPIEMPKQKKAITQDCPEKPSPPKMVPVSAPEPPKMVPISAPEPKDINIVMGNKLKKLYSGSTNQFAKAINVPPATLSENITGKRPPSIITLMKIKKIIPGFSIDKFLSEA